MSSFIWQHYMYACAKAAYILTCTEKAAEMTAKYLFLK